MSAGPLPFPLSRTSRVYIAGHRGLVGSAVWRLFEAEGFTDLVGRTSAELDLRRRGPTFDFFAETRPDVVVLAAARVGGIGANDARPVDFLSDNLQIQTNVLDAAHTVGVERLLFLGSSCIYPRNAPQPIPESALMTGELEPTNVGYAMAKLAGITLVQSYRRQHGHAWISVMPTNLYGPGDNFDLETAHVLPALIRRFEEARLSGTTEVVLWGSGRPRREFLYVDDLAQACLVLLERFDAADVVNVGTGQDIEIRDVATIVADVVGYEGQIAWDRSRPDGVARKVLDVSMAGQLGWSPSVELRDGISRTLTWFRREADHLRRRRVSGR